MTTSPTLIIGEGWLTQRRSGLNRYVADLALALADAGYPATTMAIGPADTEVLASDPTHITVSSDKRSTVRRMLAIRRAVRSLPQAPDLIDAHFALYMLPIIGIARRRKTPLVVHFHGPWADESLGTRSRPASALKRAIERRVYRSADRVVVLSDAFGNIVVDRYGVDPNRVHVVPPAVDLHHFAPGDRQEARSVWGFAPDDFVAVAVRRLEARMGLDILLTAWAAVVQACPNAHLLIAGTGHERDTLEAASSGLGLSQRVRWLGDVNDVELVTLYRAANCSVVPSRALEGFGLVVLESIACGTPAIVTDVAGLPSGVIGLDPTLIVAAEQPVELADRLVAASRGLLPDAVSCRAHAEHFSRRALADRTIDLYREASAPRLRVAFVGHASILSGAEIALVRLVRCLDVEAHVILAEDGPLVDELRALGADVEVLAMADRMRELRRERVRPTRLPVRALVDSIRYTLRLAKRLRSLRPDIVHTTTLKANLYGGLAGRLARRPVVWHVNDRIADDYLPSAAVRLVGVAARVVPSAIIAMSDSVRSVLPLRARRRTVVAYPGIAPLDIPPPATDAPVVIGMVGRLAPWKGQHLLLDAVARAFPDGGVETLIVGDALFGEHEYAAGLQHQAERLRISDSVTFSGHVTDVTAEYARMHIIVHASLSPEPFGQVVLEGMSAGRPVVAANAGGPVELITQAVDGLLFAPGDVEELAHHLTALVADPALRRQLGGAARRRSLDFTPERTAAVVMSVYRSQRRPETASTSR